MENMYEGSLCVCCMSTDNLVELFGAENSQSEDNYAKLMGACLNIQLPEDKGHDLICTDCAAKLNDCVQFKKQALRSICILSSLELTQLISNEDIQILGLNKQTKPNSEPNIDIELDLEIERLDEDELFENDENIEKSCQMSRDNVIDEPPPKIEAKPKRPIGRPRLHSRDNLPYRVENDELTCRECGEEFPCNITLKVHYNNHFGKHSCKTCGKRFMKHSSLKKHETSHLKGPFTCEDCGQQFRALNTLYSHKRYKHKYRLPFRCKQCGAAFSTLQRRLKHLADVHQLAERRYACVYCPRLFSNAGERSKHIANKHEIKLVLCLICGVRCRRNCLRAHMRRHTDKEMVKRYGKPAERRFACKLCDKLFTQKSTLKYHIGSHIRRGQYDGDPDYLIIDRRNPKAKETGILSEDETEEQHLDESLLSDEAHDDEEDKSRQKTDKSEDLSIRESDIEILDESIIDILSDIGFSDLEM